MLFNLCWCIIFIKNHTINDSLLVFILVAPDITISTVPSIGAWIVLNSMIQLICQVNYGSLPMNLSWTHSLYNMTRPVNNTTGNSISLNITISSIRVDDYGNYTCEASNRFGERNKTITLVEACKCSILIDLKLLSLFPTSCRLIFYNHSFILIPYQGERPKLEYNITWTKVPNILEFAYYMLMLYIPTNAITWWVCPNKHQILKSM